MLFFFPSLLFAEPTPSNAPPSETTSTEEQSDTPENQQETEQVGESIESTEEQEEVGKPEQEEQQKPQIDPRAEQFDQLLRLLSEDTPTKERIKLINDMHTLPNVLKSIQFLALYGTPELRSAIINVLSQHPEEDITYTIAQETLKNKPTEDIYADVFALLANLDNQRAAEILKDELENTSHSTAKRQEIRTILSTRYSSWFSTQNVSTSTNDMRSRVIFSLGGAYLGQSLLSTLGTISQGDDGAAIGSFTGVVTGAVGAALYSQNTPMSLGSATHFTHSTIWGSVIGHSIAYTFDFDYSDNLQAISRSLGALGGAAYSVYTIQNPRTFRDMMESNIIIGESILFSMALNGVTNGDSDTAFLIGSLGGFALAEAIAPKWKPNGNTVLLSSIYSVEAGLLGILLYDNTNVDADIITVMAHSGLILGCIQDHFTEVNFHTIGMAAFGAYTGNLIGAGVDILDGNGDFSFSAVGGSIGAVGGSFLSKNTPFLTPGYLMGSSGLVVANTMGLGFIMSENYDSNALFGGYLLATGLGNLGMASFQDKLNLNGEKAIFLASTSLWGTYLATTGMSIAFEEPPSEYTAAKILLGSFDAGLATGVYLLSREDFHPANTINTQFMAVLGGTLGSFGGYLISPTPRGAAIGSLVGVAGGGYLGTKFQLNLPKKTWFDNLFVQASPQLQPSGELGAQVQISGILGGKR